MATSTTTATTTGPTHHGSSPIPLQPLNSHHHDPPTASLPPSPTPLAEPPGPKTPLLKLLSTGLSFFVAGLNDGALGALIPHLLRSYGITTALVSVFYAGTLAGWVAAALTSTHLAQRLRLGSLLALGAGLQAAAHALRCGWEVPFGVFVAGGFVASLGQAWQDTWGNTFVASLATVAPTSTGEGAEQEPEGKKGTGSVHRWLGSIHAMYMAGCLVAPFGAASIAAGGRWWLYYTVPLGSGVVNLAMVLVAFRDSLGFARRGPQMADGDGAQGKKGASSLIKDALSQKNVWLLGLFFFFYLGVVITAGGWVVEYLVDVRNGDIAQMGYVPAGFSGGCLLGRILLPEPTHRFGEKKMVFIYCVLCFAFQLLFWLVPNIIAASVAISFLGFFSGPFFATAISVGTRLFPADISPTAISFVFVFAQTGGSFFPIVTGVIGAHAGVAVMQPILVGLIVAMTISWLLVPQPKGKMT